MNKPKRPESRGYASSELNAPTFLVFGVPEPATWALLGAGAAALALAAPRRRTRAA